MTQPPTADYDWKSDETVSGQVPSVEHTIGVFSGPGHLYGRTWFRGQSRAEWDLRPTILRNGVRDALIAVTEHFTVSTKLDDDQKALWAEGRLNREFRRRAASMVLTPRDPVEVYFAAQHNGLATRLLDWTTNLLAALFFATVADPDADGKLFALSPELGIYPGEFGGRIESARTADDAEVRTVLTALFTEEPWTVPAVAEGVIPIVPDLQAGRMFQQGACFTFHPPGVAGVPLAGPTGVIIPREAKPQFQETLRRVGVSWATLFPEPDFVARDLTMEFGLGATEVNPSTNRPRAPGAPQ